MEVYCQTLSASDPRQLIGELTLRVMCLKTGVSASVCGWVLLGLIANVLHSSVTVFNRVCGESFISSITKQSLLIYELDGARQRSCSRSR